MVSEAAGRARSRARRHAPAAPRSCGAWCCCSRRPRCCEARGPGDVRDPAQAAVLAAPGAATPAAGGRVAGGPAGAVAAAPLRTGRGRTASAAGPGRPVISVIGSEERDAPPPCRNARRVAEFRQVKTWLDAWPVYRQLTGSDPLGRGKAARSKATESVVSRTATADRVVQSVCPYCAVGCGQKVFVKDEKIVQIEGDPDSPISRGRLCPKGSASKQLVTSPTRVHEGPVPPSVRDGVGGPRPRHGDGDDRRPRPRRPAQGLAGRGRAASASTGPWG